MATPTCVSTSATFSMEDGSNRGEVTRFSTARTTPWLVRTAMAVDPAV